MDDNKLLFSINHEHILCHSDNNKLNKFIWYSDIKYYCDLSNKFGVILGFDGLYGGVTTMSYIHDILNSIKNRTNIYALYINGLKIHNLVLKIPSNIRILILDKGYIDNLRIIANNLITLDLSDINIKNLVISKSNIKVISIHDTQLVKPIKIKTLKCIHMLEDNIIHSLF